jgi:hypothetical protein
MINSRLFQFILQHACKWSGWQTLEIFQMLPVPPLNMAKMTDDEIENFFNISEEESHFINTVVGKK